MRVLCAPAACAPDPRSAAEVAGPPFRLAGSPAKIERTLRGKRPGCGSEPLRRGCGRSPRFLTGPSVVDGAPEGLNWEMTFWRPTDPLGQRLALLALVAAVRA
jgi:hypothetical protein